MKRCKVCDSDKTRMFNKNGRTIEKWYKFEGGHKCNRCYMREYMNKMYAKARLYK